MLTRLGRWMAAAVFICTGPLGLAVNASAQEIDASPAAFEAPKFTISPVAKEGNQWFEVTIDPGDVLNLTTSIRNTGTVPVALRTYAANAFNPPNGGFNAASDEEAPTGATLWINYPAATLDLEPGEEQQLDFTVSVPAGTPAGEYVVGLVAQTVESLGIPGSETFRQIIRNSVSVEITVPGTMTSGFTLGTPTVALVGTQWVLEVPVINTGTARVRPLGEMVVSTNQGEVVVTAPVEMGSVYGGNTSSVRIVLPEQLEPGEYLLSGTLTDDATGTTSALDQASIALVAPDTSVAVFVVESVTITPNGEPVQFANIAATITNNGQMIPTALVTLNVQRDGQAVESYPLAQNQALLQGSSDFSDRYIPLDGWLPGTYTFQLVIASVNIDDGTVSTLATIDAPEEIVVP